MVTTVVDEETGEEKKRLINRMRWKGYGPISISFFDSTVCRSCTEWYARSVIHLCRCRTNPLRPLKNSVVSPTRRSSSGFRTRVVRYVMLAHQSDSSTALPRASGLDARRYIQPVHALRSSRDREVSIAWPPPEACLIRAQLESPSTTGVIRLPGRPVARHADTTWIRPASGSRSSLVRCPLVVYRL